MPKGHRRKGAKTLVNRARQYLIEPYPCSDSIPSAQVEVSNSPLQFHRLTLLVAQYKLEFQLPSVTPFAHNEHMPSPIPPLTPTFHSPSMPIQSPPPVLHSYQGDPTSCSLGFILLQGMLQCVMDVREDTRNLDLIMTYAYSMRNGVHSHQWVHRISTE